MRNPIILVIDSGVGGLSVTEHIRQRCPGASIFYIADALYFPYGQKSEKQIMLRMHTLVAYGQRHIEPDLVVVACNTASTVALESLRQAFPGPFVGVVPAIKPAAQQSASGIIGVLATRGTVNGPYTKNLISSFAREHGVFLYGSSILVEVAESKLQGTSPCQRRLREDVEKLLCQHRSMDTIVLACTHFPLLRAELQTCFPEIRYWVDSGEAIARRVESLLTQMGLKVAGTALESKLLVTADLRAAYVRELVRPLLGQYTVAQIDI